MAAFNGRRTEHRIEADMGQSCQYAIVHFSFLRVHRSQALSRMASCIFAID